MVIGSGEQDINTAIISFRFEQQKQEIKEYVDEESRLIKDDMVKEANDRQRLEIRQSYTSQALTINTRSKLLSTVIWAERKKDGFWQINLYIK